MGYNAGASAEIGSGALVPSRHSERASGEAAAAAAASFSVLQASAPFSSTAASARVLFACRRRSRSRRASAARPRPPSTLNTSPDVGAAAPKSAPKFLLISVVRRVRNWCGSAPPRGAAHVHGGEREQTLDLCHSPADSAFWGGMTLRLRRTGPRNL